MNKFFVFLIFILSGNAAFAGMFQTEINGVAVEYYVPELPQVQTSSDPGLLNIQQASALQPSVKVLLADPTPLPDDYVPIRNPLLDQSLLRSVTPSTTTFTIDYIADGDNDAYGERCYTFPEDAKAAFTAAASIWASNIVSAVPITIQACWASLPGSSTLGYSGGYSTSNTLNVPLADTAYKLALLNAFAGSEQFPAYYDMYITYNKDFDWYTGLDGNPGQNQSDLLTVVLHEMAHGLNFSGGMTYSGGEGSYDGYPHIFDRKIEDGLGNSLINDYTNPSAALGTALLSNDLWFNDSSANAANGDTPVKIYAPSSWMSGSSIYHLDSDTYDNTPNQLMVYALAKGEAVHDPGAVTLGILKDVGWTMVNNPPVQNQLSPAIINYLLD